MGKQKKKQKKRGNPLWTLVFLAALAVFCFSGYKLIGIYLDYKTGTDEYRDLQQYTTEITKTPETPAPTKTEEWEDNQHKIYNAYDRIVIRLYEAHENGGEDLEALYKEQERIEKALELIDACVIDGLVYATYEDGLILKDLIWAYNARH